MGCSPGDEVLSLTRCHSYLKTLKGGSPSVADPTPLKDIKGKIFVFFSLSFVFVFTVAHFMA